jgi:hypothetical protein
VRVERALDSVSEAMAAIRASRLSSEMQWCAANCQSPNFGVWREFTTSQRNETPLRNEIWSRYFDLRRFTLFIYNTI